VQKAVANQNQQFAVGRLGQAVEQSFAVTTKGRLTEPAEFDNIIIRAATGGAAIVRLKDVGRAELARRTTPSGTPTRASRPRSWRSSSRPVPTPWMYPPPSRRRWPR